MIPAVALLGGVLQLAPALVKLFKGAEANTEVAELAADVARKVTGTTDNATALEVLQASPDKLLEYQQAILTQEAALEKLAGEDRADARARDVEYLKHGKRNYRADFLVGVSVAIVVLILAVVIWKPQLSEFAKGSLTTILGVFLNKITDVFSFEFGTTRKTEENQTRITNEYIKS